jgi:hypothetical protein
LSQPLQAREQGIAQRSAAQVEQSADDAVHAVVDLRR